MKGQKQKATGIVATNYPMSSGCSTTSGVTIVSMPAEAAGRYESGVK